MAALYSRPANAASESTFWLFKFVGERCQKSAVFDDLGTIFAYSEVVAETPPEIHPQRTRNGGPSTPGCGPTGIATVWIQGDRIARCRPSRTPLAVSRTRTNTARRSCEDQAYVIFVRIRHMRCRTRPESERTPDTLAI